jgi:integrase
MTRLFFLPAEYYPEGEAGVNTVKVMIRAKLDGKYPYLPAVVNGNGRIKPGVALINGLQTKVQGTYYLRYTENGKRRFALAGSDAADAANEARRKELALKAKAAGIKIVESMASDRVVCTEAVEKYLDRLRLGKRPLRSISGKKRNLTIFAAGSPHKKYLDEFNRDDVLLYKSNLEKGDYAPKTVDNMMMSVVTFFNQHEIRLKLKKEDWPKYKENPPEPYTEPEMRSLLKHSEGASNLLIRTLAATGGRDQEISHMTKADLDSRRRVVRVQPKPCTDCPECRQRGNVWYPKTEESVRDIPVSEKLLSELHAQPGERPFAADNGKVDGHLLRRIKKVAKEAGVSNAKLHRFRDTFITNKIRDGEDVRTVQKWAGHTGVNVTMGYAAWLEAESERARESANREDNRYSASGT